MNFLLSSLIHVKYVKYDIHTWEVQAESAGSSRENIVALYNRTR